MMNRNQMINNMRNQMIRNPQQFAQNALRSGRFNNDKLMSSALNAVANNDINSMQTIANNVCREHNVSLEDAQKQYKQYYGI